MLTLQLDLAVGASPHPAASGAHSDDIEIGCGGTLLRLIDALPSVEVHWVVLSGERARRRPARAPRRSSKAPRQVDVIAHVSRRLLPLSRRESRNVFEDLKAGRARLDLHPLRDDLHQDHRLVAELTWNTFRDHLILEYEIPKYDGDLGSPNVFVGLTDARRGTEGSAAPRALPDAAGAALVYGGSLPRGATNPRDGIEFAVWARRGLLRPQGGSDARSEGGGSRERRRSDPRRRGAPVQHDPVEKGA